MIKQTAIILITVLISLCTELSNAECPGAWLGDTLAFENPHVIKKT